MRSSARLSLYVGVVLTLSLAGKLVGSLPAPRLDNSAPARALESMLDRAGYRTALRTMNRSPGVVAEARLGSCTIVGGDYPAHGTLADIYADLARPIGPLHYAYRGRLYATPPRLESLIRVYIWREMRRIGLPRRRSAIIALAATPSCRLEALRWAEIATVSG